MFTIGKKFDQFIGSQSGFMFDIIDGCGVLFVVVDKKNIEQFKLGGHYDFWCTSYNETLFFAARIKNNLWHSAPYTPHLSSQYKLSNFDKGMGMPLSIVLISNENGIIEDVDFLSLGNEFSNTLYYLCADILDKPFDSQRHSLTIQAVYQKFSTDEILVEQPGATYSID